MIVIESPTGSGFEDVFVQDIDEFGHTILTKSREHNLYEEIQSYKDSCDINNILARYANGDPSGLFAANAQYFDATNMPTTFAELFQRVNDCERIFNELPLDVREKFNNSTYEFWSQMGSDLFAEKIADCGFSAPDVGREVMDSDLSDKRGSDFIGVEKGVKVDE